MAILSLDTLPWILLAIVGARALLTAARLAVVSEQLAQTHARLREAQDAREIPARRSSPQMSPRLHEA